MGEAQPRISVIKSSARVRKERRDGRSPTGAERVPGLHKGLDHGGDFPLALVCQCAGSGREPLTRLGAIDLHGEALLRDVLRHHIFPTIHSL
ncbi:MAG: hypothetical protein JW963_11230 [Anaerolineales bacterium]|nr:hypothetical protein [Anaerolineales bacterium]